MDLQGIGAMAAAAVAVVGIPTTLILGRWQLRGALRGAEETARAGMAQADASYRSALDAVRAQGQNDHLQWRRGVQRDAYAAFLQSVLSYTDTARNNFGGSICLLEETRNRIASLKSLEMDMSHRAWVVRLEGPYGVADAAITLQQSASLSVLVDQQHALQMGAMYEINDRAPAHPHEVARIWELIPVAKNFWHTIGTSAMEDSSTDVLQELHNLFNTCEISGGLLATICQPYEPSPENITPFREAINAFIRAASEALSPAGPPAP
ncbi:hypothetical protein AB0L28_33305 [Streptomyces sp. NPDC052503]|uniref:hypothetical protein n=1 Tax=Streptomyces sp. NPDC052503 TaxID=3156683 RepID=UPI00136BE776|nr:hypothetical protein [Streptomyces sp. SID7834]MYT57920.1 hypothetical protein [Streptomyces sp. SID7834]